MCYSIVMGFIKLPLSIAVASMAHGDSKFNDSHRTYGHINNKKDLNYCSDGEKEHCLDILTNPTKSNGITLFNIHGGAYVYGYKEDSRIFTSWFVDKGFTVIPINYRLARKDGSISIMDQAKDAVEALKFVVENAVHYGVSLKNLFLMGDSAGGHICLMLDILSKSEEARKYYQLEDFPKVEIKGVALNSPMYDYMLVRAAAKEVLSKRSRRWMLSKQYLDDEFINKNNPRYYFKNGFKPSPLFASTSYYDYFNNQSQRLKKDCDELGINIDYLFEASPDKSIGHVYNHFHFEDEEGKRCNNMMVDFFIRNSKVDK